MTKTFLPLENNPEVLTPLAHRLGLSPDLKFQDVYSLTDPDLLALIPRPVHALLFVYPITPTSESFFESDQASRSPHPDSTTATGGNPTGDDSTEPVLWFPQTIHHACGLHGLLHCTTSSASARAHVLPATPLAQLVTAATPLSPTARTTLLETSPVIESAHAEAAERGDTVPPPLGEDPGHAFVAFVRGTDGHLWEMEGRGKGPKDLGEMADGEDVLSPAAVERGPLQHIQREKEAAEGGVVRFSCTALVEGW